VTFKDLKKRVVSETAQQQHQHRLFERLHNKPFGYGILKIISGRILERMEIAVLTILLVYLPKKGWKKQSLIMRK
jgi:hypothetical protein